MAAIPAIALGRFDRILTERMIKFGCLFVISSMTVGNYKYGSKCKWDGRGTGRKNRA